VPDITNICSRKSDFANNDKIDAEILCAFDTFCDDRPDVCNAGFIMTNTLCIMKDSVPALATDFDFFQEKKAVAPENRVTLDGFCKSLE